MIRYLFSLFGLLYAVVAMCLFIIIGVMVWSVRGEVDRETEAVACRANKALDSADRAIGVVREIIDKAETDLAYARKEALEAPPPSTPMNPLVQMTARKASQDLAGSVERAHHAILTASEAVVVADAALDVVGGVPELKKLFGVKPEQVVATRTALDTVSSELQQARSALGIPPTGPQSLPTREQLSAVDNALSQAQQFTNEVGGVVDSTRKRVNETKNTVDFWTWRVALGTSLAAGIAALGQLFMAQYFWWYIRRYRSYRKNRAATTADATA